MKAGTMLYHAMGIRPSTVGRVQAFSDNVFHITFRIHIPLAASKKSFPSILTYKVDQFLIIIFQVGMGGKILNLETKIGKNIRNDTLKLFARSWKHTPLTPCTN